MTHGGCTCQPNPYPNPILRWMPPQANLQEYISRQSHKRETHTAEGQHTVQQTTDISQQTTERSHDRKTYGTQNKTNTRDWKRSGTEQNEKLRRRGRVKVGGGRTTTAERHDLTHSCENPTLTRDYSPGLLSFSRIEVVPEFLQSRYVPLPRHPHDRAFI